MELQMNRRYFLGTSASAISAAALAQNTPPAAAPARLVVGVMGMGGRGTAIGSLFAQQPGVTVAYVCDPDRTRLAAGVERIARNSERPPQGVADFRRMLDDRDVQIMVCAAPNHWHAPASILATAAGKNVYVEKPCSHNPREGELLVASARRNNKHVQMGNQRRSWPKVMEGIELVRSGGIGRAYLAKSWYLNTRPSIARGAEGPAPETLDYDLWQGPAPRRPFKSNYLHYNWHWFWNWGNGELGNNGVHTIDLCRWGLGVDYPVRVTSAAGRYRFEDDQETPDTHNVVYEFDGRKAITWEGLSCNRFPSTVATPEALFLGETGSLAIINGGYVLYDDRGRETRRAVGAGNDAMHIANFLDVCRGNGRLNSEIDEGHKSTLLCHLGNIAHRVSRPLTCDPANGHVRNDEQAMRFWSREYAQGWEPRG